MTYEDSAEACEARAEARGMGCMYAGGFPELPQPAAPTFVHHEPASVVRLRNLRRETGRVASHRRWAI